MFPRTSGPRQESNMTATPRRARTCAPRVAVVDTARKKWMYPDSKIRQHASAEDDPRQLWLTLRSAMDDAPRLAWSDGDPDILPPQSELDLIALTQAAWLAPLTVAVAPGLCPAEDAPCGGTVERAALDITLPGTGTARILDQMTGYVGHAYLAVAPGVILETGPATQHRVGRRRAAPEARHRAPQTGQRLRDGRTHHRAAPLRQQPVAGHQWPDGGCRNTVILIEHHLDVIRLQSIPGSLGNPRARPAPRACSLSPRRFPGSSSRGTSSRSTSSSSCSARCARPSRPNANARTSRANRTPGRT
jgi:hypothetical protein